MQADPKPVYTAVAKPLALEALSGRVRSHLGGQVPTHHIEGTIPCPCLAKSWLLPNAQLAKLSEQCLLTTAVQNVKKMALILDRRLLPILRQQFTALFSLEPYTCWICNAPSSVENRAL